MALSVSDRLKKSAAAPKTKSGKNDKPVLTGAEKLVDDVVTTKKAIEDLEAKMAELESTLRVQTYAAYDAARKNGQYSSSIFCEGSATPGCMQVFSDKFSALPTDMESNLRKQDPNYDRHFVEVRKLTVKRDAGKTVSDAIIEKLLTALGEDFDKILEVKVEIGTVKGMAEMWEELPDGLKEMLKDLQAKPSTRNVTVDGKVV